jgi:EmrB/QacA subfamily drug resistance transporter
VSAPSGALPADRPRHLGLALGLLAFAQLIIALDYNIVFVALPKIGDGLGFTEYTLQWVVSAYAVAFGGFLLLGGRAADLFGRRRMFVLGLALYAVASVAGGLATEPLVLIVARVVQGLGGAFLAPATLSFVTTLFAEGKERNRALSIWGAAGSTGMVLGSLLGGVLTQTLGWPSVFFVNVLFAGVGIALAFVLIPADAPGKGSGNFDLVGALSATGGALLLVFSLVQGPSAGWAAPATLVSLGVAVVLLAIFLVTEARRRDPLMPLGLFRNRNLSAGTVVTFLFMASFGAIAYFLTIYFQALRGYSALNTGFAFVLPCVCVLVGTVLGGRLVTRFGVRVALVVATVPGGLGTVWLALSLAETGSYLNIVAPLTILSVGQGIVFTTAYAAATTGVPAEDQGIASGIATTGQQVGGAVGLAVLIATTSGLVDGPAESLASLRTATFAIAVGIGLTLLVAFVFRQPPAAQPTKQAEPSAAPYPAEVTP